MLNLNQYFTVPAAGVSRSVGLGISLLSAVPADAPTSVVNAAVNMREATLALQTDWANRLGPDAEDQATRPFDAAADRAWRGLHTALQAAATLSETPRGDAATTILGQVFPDGRSFLTLAYKEQWAEGERRLQHIEAEGLESLVTTAVGGPEYLDTVRATHQSFGAALNITQAATPNIDVDLSQGVELLRNAIRSYLLQVVAWANQAPANESAAKNALLPVEAARREWTSRRSNSATTSNPDVTPETPIPVLT